MLILGNLEKRNSTEPNPVSLLIQDSSLIHEVSSNSQNPNPPQKHRQNTSKLWRHPVIGTIKINSDATFDVNRQKGVAGIIGWNDKGEVVLGLTTVFPVTLALQAEVIATRDSAILASNLQISRVVFESDNLELIQSCRNEIERRVLEAVIQDINVLRTDFDRVVLSGPAPHMVENLAKRSLLNVAWKAFPPPQLKLVLDKDARGGLHTQYKQAHSQSVVGLGPNGQTYEDRHRQGEALIGEANEVDSAVWRAGVSTSGS